MAIKEVLLSGFLKSEDPWNEFSQKNLLLRKQVYIPERIVFKSHGICTILPATVHII